MDRSVVILPSDPILPGGLLLNATALLAVCGYLGALLHQQWQLAEPPCEWSLLERTGAILTGMGFLKNLRHGVKSAHYGVALLGALLTGVMAIAHLHLPAAQHAHAGVALFSGMSGALLAALFALAAALVIALLLGLKSAEYPAVLQLLQSAEHTDQIRRWPWGRIVVSLLFLLTVAAHLVVQILLCQPLSCSDLLWLRMSAFQG